MSLFSRRPIVIHLHNEPDQRLHVKLNQILWMLRRLTQGEALLMATIADVEAAVTENGDVVQSAITLLDQLTVKLNEALAANDPAAVQAVVDEISAQKEALATAVAANTPAA